MCKKTRSVMVLELTLRVNEDKSFRPQLSLAFPVVFVCSGDDDDWNDCRITTCMLMMSFILQSPGQRTVGERRESDLWVHQWTNQGEMQCRYRLTLACIYFRIINFFKMPCDTGGVQIHVCNGLHLYPDELWDVGLWHLWWIGDL